MLPEVKSLLEALSRDDDDLTFYNNDNDYDLDEVLEFMFDGKIHKHKLPYDDGTVRTTSYYKESPNKEWHSLDIEPEQDAWVVVKDKNNNEREYYQWLGTWYSFVINEDGSEDGSRADMEGIVAWRYQ